MNTQEMKEALIKYTKPKNVCVDLDGVLAQYDGWKGEAAIGDPYPGAREFLEELKLMGFIPIIHTTRPPTIVYQWLASHGLSDMELEVRGDKPPAVAYIDDRAICHRGKYQATLEALWNFHAYWEPLFADGFQICSVCGRPYPTAWQAPNEIWDKVAGNVMGTLCLGCFDEMAEKKGVLLFWECAQNDYPTQKRDRNA